MLKQPKSKVAIGEDRSYPYIVENEDGWSDWIWIRDNRISIGCCDCDLVHHLAFEIDHGELYMKASRDDKETERLRSIKDD